MRKNKAVYFFPACLISISAVFLNVAPVSAAYDITAVIDNDGDGTGQVTGAPSADSAWKFIEWRGRSCIGVNRGANCVLNRVKRNDLKEVTATFDDLIRFYPSPDKLTVPIPDVGIRPFIPPPPTFINPINIPLPSFNPPVFTPPITVPPPPTPVPLPIPIPPPPPVPLPPPIPVIPAPLPTITITPFTGGVDFGVVGSNVTANPIGTNPIGGNVSGQIPFPSDFGSFGTGGDSAGSGPGYFDNFSNDVGTVAGAVVDFFKGLW